MLVSLRKRFSAKRGQRDNPPPRSSNPRTLDTVDSDDALRTYHDDEDSIARWTELLDRVNSRGKSEESSGPSPRTVATDSAQEDLPLRATASAPIPIPDTPRRYSGSLEGIPNVASSPSSTTTGSGSTLAALMSTLRRSRSSSALSSSNKSAKGWDIEMQMHGYGVSPNTQAKAMAVYKESQARRNTVDPVATRQIPELV